MTLWNVSMKKRDAIFILRRPWDLFPKSDVVFATIGPYWSRTVGLYCYSRAIDGKHFRAEVCLFLEALRHALWLLWLVPEQLSPPQWSSDPGDLVGWCWPTIAVVFVVGSSPELVEKFSLVCSRKMILGKYRVHTIDALKGCSLGHCEPVSVPLLRWV